MILGNVRSSEVDALIGYAADAENELQEAQEPSPPESMRHFTWNYLPRDSTTITRFISTGSRNALRILINAQSH